MTYQNIILKVLATKRARHTSKEKPSASCVLLICLYCGMYGIIPPIIMAPALTHPTTVPTVSDNSSDITQSILKLQLNCLKELYMIQLCSIFIAGVCSVICQMSAVEQNVKAVEAHAHAQTRKMCLQRHALVFMSVCRHY